MPGKKQDARVRYTKMVIKSSLMELMQAKPVAKITDRMAPPDLYICSIFPLP